MYGNRWLGSCRAPSVTEMNAVAECLEEGNKRDSQEYQACLKGKGVRYGDRIE